MQNEYIYLARKNGAVIAHTDLPAMLALDGIAEPELTVTAAEWEEAGGLARLVNGEIILGVTEEELAAQARREEREGLEAELAGFLAEIAARDYRALKAFKLGAALDELYPGESEWYQGRVAAVNELETRIAALPLEEAP